MDGTSGVEHPLGIEEEDEEASFLQPQQQR